MKAVTLKSMVVAAGLALVLGLSATGQANATVVGTAKFQGKTYYVDVLKCGATATVWFRVKANACSLGDFQAMNLKANNMTMTDAAKLICRAKSVYDGGKTLVGCGATIATGLCAAGAAPTGGATVAICSGAIMYTADKGLADCIDGVSGYIASFLGQDKVWAAAGFSAKLAGGQWTGAIDKAIDAACADLKKKK